MQSFVLFVGAAFAWGVQITAHKERKEIRDEAASCSCCVLFFMAVASLFK